MGKVKAPVEKIAIPQRIRRDLGDIEGLAKSIEELGLLQPIVLRSDGNGGHVLVAGERRLMAHKLLGLKEIPYVDLPNALPRSSEIAENQERKGFEPEEIGRVAQEVWNLVEPEPGQARRDAVGAMFGVSGVHAERCRKLVEALEQYPTLSQIMQERGARAAERELRRLQLSDAEPAELVVDPHWDEPAPLVLLLGSIEPLHHDPDRLVAGHGHLFCEQSRDRLGSAFTAHRYFRADALVPVVWDEGAMVLLHVVRSDTVGRSDPSPPYFRGHTRDEALRQLVERFTGDGETVRDLSPAGRLLRVCHGRRYVCNAVG